MKFELNGVITELDSPSQYPQTEDKERIQVSERSATGITHVEDYKLVLNYDKYVFKDMRQADYVKLMGFFINDAKCKMNKFKLTNDLGVSKVVRFISSRLSFTNTSLTLWEGEFSVEEEK